MPLSMCRGASVANFSKSVFGKSLGFSSWKFHDNGSKYVVEHKRQLFEKLFKACDMNKLRNAPFTSNEVFPVDTLSEVQRNFIQWSHVNKDSRNRKSRKEHTPRHEEKVIIGLKIGLFANTMRIHPQAQPKAVHRLQLEIEGEVPTPPGLLEAGVAGGSDCQCPGSRLSSFWQVWGMKNAHPRVVTILKEGYCLNFRIQPPLTNYPVIRSKYLNREKQEFLIKVVYQMIDKKAITPVQKVTSPGFYSRLFLVPKPGKKWRPVIDLSVVNKYLHVPTFKMETVENIRDSLQQESYLTRPYRHLLPHSNSSEVSKVSSLQCRQ